MLENLSSLLNRKSTFSSHKLHNYNARYSGYKDYLQEFSECVPPQNPLVHIISLALLYQPA